MFWILILIFFLFKGDWIFISHFRFQYWKGSSSAYHFKLRLRGSLIIIIVKVQSAEKKKSCNNSELLLRFQIAGYTVYAVSRPAHEKLVSSFSSLFLFFPTKEARVISRNQWKIYPQIQPLVTPQMIMQKNTQLLWLFPSKKNLLFIYLLIYLIIYFNSQIFP